MSRNKRGRESSGIKDSTRLPVGVGLATPEVTQRLIELLSCDGLLISLGLTWDYGVGPGAILPLHGHVCEDFLENSIKGQINTDRIQGRGLEE